MSRAVQLVLLSVIILTCLQTGVTHKSDDGKSLLWKQYTCVIQACKYSLASGASPLSRDNGQFLYVIRTVPTIMLYASFNFICALIVSLYVDSLSLPMMHCIHLVIVFMYSLKSKCSSS